jgi:N-acetylmuramic acid 6-phosphate etherase
LGVLDASECPPTFGVSPELVVGIIAGGDRALRHAVEGAEDSAEEGAQAIASREVAERDVVIGIATSGRTPYVLGALREAHRRGARTALLSCTPPDEDLRTFVDGFLTPLVGPEILTGSTRLKAGTATKLILNQITTIAMIRLGKAYDNWMVDLQATNTKLQDRARRIVMAITGVDVFRAQAALDAAQGRVKTAIVMVAHGLEADAATRHLEAHRGHLRSALTHSPARGHLSA